MDNDDRFFQIAILLYQGVTGLDVVGPWEALSRIPNADVRIVRSGKIATAAGVSAGIDLALWLAGEIAGSEQSGQVNVRGVHTQAAGAGIRRYDNGL